MDSVDPLTLKLLRSIPNGQAPRDQDNEIEGGVVAEKPATTPDDKLIDPFIVG